MTADGRRAQRDVEVTMCPDGPMLLRGATQLIGTDGARHQVERPVVAVCRCGKTGRAPWCDGTHKLLSAPRP